MLRIIAISVCLLISACSSFQHHDINVITPVCIKPFEGYKYKTCNEIILTIDQTYYYIPANFETDLATIPRLIWPIVSPAYSSVITPAIVHDWFYRMTCDFTRLETDIIFRQMMIDNNMSKFDAAAMYYAVRLFGGHYYNEDYCE